MIPSNSIDEDEANSHGDDEVNVVVEDSTNNGAATASSLTYEGPVVRGVVGDDDDDVEIDRVVDPSPTEEERESDAAENQEEEAQPRLTPQHLEQLEHQQQRNHQGRHTRIHTDTDHVPVGIQQAVAGTGVTSGIIMSPSGGYYPYNISGSTSGGDLNDEYQDVWKREMKSLSPPTLPGPLPQPPSMLPSPPKTTNSMMAMQTVEESKHEEGSKVDEGFITSSSHHSPTAYRNTPQHLHLQVDSPGRHQIQRQLKPTSASATSNTLQNTEELKSLYIRIDQQQHMHRLSSIHYLALHHWFLFLPSILLTVICGLTALIFEAEVFAISRRDVSTINENSVKVYVSIGVGFVAITSAIWQCVAQQLQYNVRGEVHKNAAISLKRLTDDILLFSESSPSLSSTSRAPGSTSSNLESYVVIMSARLQQILDTCDTKGTTIPFPLEIAYSSLTVRMGLELDRRKQQHYRIHQESMEKATLDDDSTKKRRYQPSREEQAVSVMKSYSIGYEGLSMAIGSYWAWPFKFPQPSQTIDKALHKFNSIMIPGYDRNRNCLDDCGGFMRYYCCCCPSSYKEYEDDGGDYV